MPHAPEDHRHPDAHSHERLHRVSPDGALATAVEALRARGERVTGARRAVLRLLANTSEHLSADEVALRLESADPGVHRATVYRTLDVLTDLGVVSQVNTTTGANVYHFASSPAGSEHLHAHCRVCGSVVVIPADSLAEVATRVSHLTGFRLEPAQSTLVGLCADCAEA
jgi:Fur family ferric uptake transcriptional regulator